MKMLKILILCGAITAVSAAAAFAAKAGPKLAFAPVFGDHMVLQKDMPLEIYGSAAPGKKVTVELQGQTVATKADSKGEWTVKIAPLDPGGPFSVSIKSGDEILILNDVLAGDVWFCSGQSNMELALMNTADGADELKNFEKQDNIRLFLQQQVPSQEPLKDASGSWTACDADNAKNFSAVAYFMAKHLQKEMDVPIGLIDSSWGGTPIEIWMDKKLLKGNPATQPILDRWKNNPVFDWKDWHDGRGMDYGLEISDVRFMSSSGKAEPVYVKVTPSAGAGFGGNWSSWAKPGSTAVFADAGKNGKLSGIIGFNAWAGAGTMLKDGPEVDLSAYDTLAFKAKGAGKFSVGLTQNTILDFDYYSSPDYDLAGQWREFSIKITDLKQAGWGLAKPFTQNAVKQLQFNIKSITVELPSALYNGMVAPYSRFKIKGAVWYQGENNAWRAAQYKVLLPAMIKNWRETWAEGDFPFLVVQLPNYMERKNDPSDSAWAELREAQLSALSITNTAVVPIIDLGEEKDIHPRHKEPVGARLAQAALVISCGKQGPATGPIYDSMSITGNRITIKFKNTGKGLEARNGDLKGFAISGDDRQFKWAKAEIKDDTLIVWNDDVKEPKAVRYAWADNPECNLYNKEGLAASPFRTDEWKGLTDSNY
jgi:sialate O-acetylesterase